MKIKRFSIQTKGLVLSIIPFLIILALVFSRNKDMHEMVRKETLRLSQTDLEHIARGVRAMCETQQELLQQTIDNIV